MSLPLAWVDDPLFDQHRAPASHPERAERLHAARAALVRADIGLPRLLVSARDASDEELYRVHSEEYLRSLDLVAGAQGYFDADTFYSPLSVAAARRAAGAALELIQALLERRARFGLALVRPPGHHARPGMAMGFCLLNNVAVAAAHARNAGAERVLVLDWDVHHGNGTQEMFWSDPHVLYVSLHQSPLYPGTGNEEETGTGDGSGFTVNIPLSAGADDAVYAAAMDRIVIPVVEQYAPQVVLVSAGFDAHRRDPLAQMLLSDQGYARMTHQLLSCISAQAQVGLVLEGGYDLGALTSALAATLNVLGGEMPSVPTGHFSERHSADLCRAEASLARFWKLK